MTIQEGYQVGSALIPKNRLPSIFFGIDVPLAYILNPKSGCTLAKKILFYLNHGYQYPETSNIHNSELALCNIREPASRDHVSAIEVYNRLQPKAFSFVREPIERFLSAFTDKIWTTYDVNYAGLRETLTCNHGLDLSGMTDWADTCSAFVRYLTDFECPLINMDEHFRPQFLNLSQDVQFPIDTILRLEDKEAIVAFIAPYAGVDTAMELIARKENSTNRDLSLRDRLSRETKELLTEYYSDDFRLYIS